MAHSDYIPCCKCDVKLIYDGDRSQRNWWAGRFGKEPEIECPNCKAAWVGLTDEDLSVWPPPKREWVGLTEEDIEHVLATADRNSAQYKRTPGWAHLIKATEAKLKEKNI